MKFLICQYSHIEGYPPTFNAVNVLAKQGHTVEVLARKDLETSWDYHSNIQLNFVGNYKTRFEYDAKSKWHKINEFFKYLKQFKLLLKKKPDVLLLYDNIPLMAWRLIRVFHLGKKPLVWYHNHDIHYLKDYKKYSLPYFAYFSLRKSFKFIDFFSLPAAERLKYFKLKNFKGKQSILPNYPPAYLFNRSKQSAPESEIKLVYPGSNISHMHGIEDIIPILNNKINGKALSLSLVGTISAKYKNTLLDIAQKHKTTDKLHFIDRMPYPRMPSKIMEYDIGVAINKPMNITYETGGTAANKIYEYPASGLPSILFDNAHYRKYFDNYKWAFFSDLSEASLLQCIQSIDDNYIQLSQRAGKDFENGFSFEKVFNITLAVFFPETANIR